MMLPLFVGCESDSEKRHKILMANAQTVDTQISRLGQHIDAGNIANTGILREYAAVVGVISPDYKAITALLVKDAGKDGPIYKSLLARAADTGTELSAGAESEPVFKRLNDEYSAIHEAAKPGNFGMAITDPINVLADMSGGKLARVAALKKQASLQENEADDLGTGSQLVGNPTYGSWQQRSNGTSLWVYYGQYRLFSDLFGGGRSTYYGSWSQRRDYSYYHDRGRNFYTSPSQRSSQQAVQKQAKQKFASQGKTFRSPYSKNKAGSLNSARRPAVKAPGKFSSSYANRPGSNTASGTSSNKKAGGWSSNFNSRNTSGGSRSSFGGK